MAPRFAFVPAKWLAPDSGLSSTDRLVLCVLCQWVNRDSGCAFPAQTTIAASAALSERSVRSAIENLERFGALVVTRRKRDTGENDTNLYTVLGYDPTPEKGKNQPATVAGTYRNVLPVGGATVAGRGVQQLPVNVFKDNKEVNSGDPTDSAVASSDRRTTPISSASDPAVAIEQEYAKTAAHSKRVKPPPYVPPPNPLKELHGASMTDDERKGWREMLHAVGVGPAVERSPTSGA